MTLLLLLLLLLQWAAAKGSKQKALVRGAQKASNTGPSWQPDKFSGEHEQSRAAHNCLFCLIAHARYNNPVPAT
jgi:hypothetical protein